MIYSGLDIWEINFHWQEYAVEKSLNLLLLLPFSFKYCSYFFATKLSLSSIFVFVHKKGPERINCTLLT